MKKLTDNQKSLDKKKGKELDWSKNKKAENIVGLRKLPKNSIIFDQPCEIDYHCPVCKYKNTVNGEYDTRLNWSEYKGFIWCSVCNKDYPSCLCMPDIDRAINIYLNCLSEHGSDNDIIRKTVKKGGQHF